MALEGTHIRTALDVKNELGIKELDKYIAGTVYPDSRYVTGVERAVAHNLDLFKDRAYRSDFYRGWHVHLLCDKIQHAMMHELLPDILRCGDENRDWWATITAIKTVQDMNDLKYFHIGDYVDFLEYAENPNNEELEKIRAYNRMVANLYRKKETPSLGEYRAKLVAFGVAEALAEEVFQKTHEYVENGDVHARICALYDRMLSLLKRALASA